MTVRTILGNKTECFADFLCNFTNTLEITRINNHLSTTVGCSIELALNNHPPSGAREKVNTISKCDYLKETSKIIDIYALLWYNYIIQIR